MCNQKFMWQYKLLQWNIVRRSYGYSHQMIFVAEDFIAMEHSVWQLVLFPRSNGVAIVSFLQHNVWWQYSLLPQRVSWQQLLMQRCYWLKYFLLRPHHVVAFVFYARRERHSIATHQNWVAITYCNIFKCHDSQRNRLRSICYVLQPKHPYCNHS